MTISKRKILFILAAYIIICSSIIMLVLAQETVFASIIDNAKDIRDVPDEEFATLYPVSEDVFDVFNAQYFKIAIGKGLIDSDNLAALIMRYADFLSVI